MSFGGDFSPASASPRYHGTLSVQSPITMTENPGYFVLRGVTSQDRAQKAAESIHEGLQPLRTSNESIEYAATPEAYEVYHDFVKV